MLKYFEVILSNFEFSQPKEIAESWLVYVNKFSITFLDRDNKMKLGPVPFSYFLEHLRDKNKF